jgi:hypothetical protein
MKTDKKTIDRLLEKYHDGETSLQEEEALRTWFEDPEHAAEYPDMSEIFEAYRSLGTLQHQEDTKTVGGIAAESPVVHMPETTASHAGYVQIRWAYGIAAALALVITGTAAGIFLANKTFVTQEHLSAMQSDIRQMKEMVSLSKLQGGSASERILATYEMKSLKHADDEVINALINTMQNDPQVNVRMAAAEALFAFGNTDKVRRAMINTLAAQDAPVLQIRLIEMLVRLRESRAIPELQKVMENEQQMQAVRDKAAQGMAVLL